MSISEHIKTVLELPYGVVQGYISDLTDADLMLRPHENCNHLAWQLGHLIESEHRLNNMVCPDSMPALPEGFIEQHSTEAAANNDASAFCTKAEYIAAMDVQRGGTIALLDRLTDEELSAPAPEMIQRFGKTVGAVIGGQSTHWMMHAGQWVIIRRNLGKPALF